MDFLAVYFKQRKKLIGIFLLFCLVFLVTFILYRLPVGAAIYPALICAALGMVFLIIDIRKCYSKHKHLQKAARLNAHIITDLPQAFTVDDSDYQQIIDNILSQLKESETLMNRRFTDMVDYFTAWAHQIKTPIASMRLNIRNDDFELLEELMRIEQYVQMVLCYLRLDSDYTDYVIAEYSLDDIIKQAVKKFSTQFIRKKIKLEYTPLNTTVITDEKWLLFVIEQVLSNALKYTPSGSITISLEKPKTLCIKDTGIGIAPDDLPRIFQKGYTGYNGRGDKKASGIGLYLCRRICNNLGYSISANSSLEGGTAIYINLDQIKLEKE